MRSVMRVSTLAPIMKPNQLAGLSQEELRSHLEVLQRQFAEIRTQRDELQRDVELMCMPSTFCSASFLQERVRNAETELARTRSKLQSVVEELSDVKDDYVHVQEAKRLSDTSAREVPVRLQACAVLAPSTCPKSSACNPLLQYVPRAAQQSGPVRLSQALRVVFGESARVRALA
jgi:flagellar biosynthesis chaperone FliJ